MSRHLVDQQLTALARREEAFLAQSGNPLTARLAPAAAALEQAVPQALRRTLETAFSKSFALVFENGDGLIRKTSNLDAIAARHRALDTAVGVHPKRSQLRAVHRQAKASGRFHLAATAAEGAGLGLLGVGLPDIPIFLGMLLREGYEIAASYGFDPSQQAERACLLCLLRAAASKGDARRTAWAQANALAAQLDAGLPVSTAAALPALIAQTASALSSALLSAKFVQGLPLIGAAGGVFNAGMSRAFSRAASLHYQRRWLVQKRPPLTKKKGLFALLGLMRRS